MITIKFEIENNRAVALDQGSAKECEKINLKKNEENNYSYDMQKYPLKEVGECNFVDEGEYWNIVHTEVSKDYQGQGIAKRLVEDVIDNANKNGKKIKADCSYAKKILENLT